ncbi:MAG: D-glycero-beta-D-manno-heptose 1-phosphate adenylyltransferase [Proteobacteria bacterium]|nr:D-glycero-beta-D-manno-heptose 1-phosphate adenylyltransferase [Pseudomonadota bacterium]
MERKNKIKSIKAIKSLTEGLKRHGKKVVFTNGCFDLLHVGHARYVRRAREAGDFLVVGLNSDASVRKIKGPGRPILPEGERAELLSALASVDAVVIFTEPTPIRLIELIRPDVLVKGADWPADQIAGGDLVRSYGGRVRRIPLAKGKSTSAIIKKIQRSNNKDVRRKG